MPLNSVQTNPGASTAIRALADAAGELAATRGRLSTGLRVASARHSSSSWTIAQQQRGDIGAFGSVLTSLQRGQSITTVALAAAETVVDLLSEMRSQALAATDSALTDAQRSACNSGFLALRDRIACTVRDAVFDGVNLLDGSSASESVLAGLPQTTSFTVTVPGGGNGGGNGGGKGGDGGGNGGGAGGGGNGGGAGGGKGGGGPKKAGGRRPDAAGRCPCEGRCTVSDDHDDRCR
jgi:flagellin